MSNANRRARAVAEKHIVLEAFNMTRGRYGVGFYADYAHFDAGSLSVAVIGERAAAALFPGMVAAGRFYADLVIGEIER